MDRLADRFLLIAPDLPGHGALAAQPFPLTAAAQNVADLIDEEARGRALLVGLSLGGLIAIELAHRQPEKAAGLILSGATQNQQAGLLFKLASQALVSYAGFARRLVGKERTRRMEINAMKKQYPLVDAAAVLGGGIHYEHYMDILRELDGQDFAARLHTFPGPVLIANGERDKDSRRHEAQFLAAAQHGSLMTIPQAGHMANLDQPDVFSGIIRQFADSIDY